MYVCMYVNKQTNSLQTKTANNKSVEKDETVKTNVWDKKKGQFSFYTLLFPSNSRSALVQG